jgi:GTP cyclohydrolase I
MERSMHYLTKCYQENPEEILLGAMFDVASDEMVIVKDMRCLVSANTTSAVFR